VAGFTLIELMIGLLVGAIAMAMVFSMFVGTSTAIRDNNNRAMAIGQVEVALQRLAKEIKYANTTNPDASTGMPAVLANTLPLLPYTQVENATYLAYTDSSGAFTPPAPPAARLFLAQNGQSPLYQSQWCPNPEMPCVPADASNSLVFYKTEPDGVTHRISLKAATVAGQLCLVRLDQSPMSASSLTDSTPPPKVTVLIRNLKSAQFTYPAMLTQVNSANGSTFGASLAAMASSQRESYLNSNFRKLIGIRVRVAVASSGGGKPAISELRTTVQVRN
jgi:prepilin-type N-terminal cleavage/methylation domain-containing protein